MPLVRRRLVLTAIVFAAALALYVPAVRYGFVWDDRSLILENRYLHDVSELPSNLTHDFFRRSNDPTEIGHWRPLVTATYMADWALGGGHPHVFHAHNAFLDALAAALIVLLALELGLTEQGAIAAGLLFAVLPAHVEAVAWISGRTDLLCGVLVLVALVLDARAGTSGSRRARIGSASATFAALLAKEMGVVVPVAAALRAAWLPGDSERARPRTTRAWRAAWPHLAAIAAYAVVRLDVLGIVPKPPGGPLPARWSLFLTWWSAFLEYLRVLLWPARLSIVPRVSLEHSPLAPDVLVGAMVFVLAAGLAWRLRERSPVVAWSLAGFLAAFAPVTNFVVPVRAPGGIEFAWAERFLFVPSIFFVIAIAAALLPPRREPGVGRIGRRTLAMATIVIAIVAAGARAAARERVWHDQRSLFEAAVREAPGDSNAQATLGAALADAGQPVAAEEHYRKALEAAPANSLAHFDLGNLLRARGDLDGAETAYRAALAARPDYPQAWLNLGLVHVARGRADDAIADFRSADAAMGGRYAEAKVDLAALVRGLGRASEAIPLYEDALRLDPSLAAARAGLEAARREMGTATVRD
jgi:protein O-mannosyl-transferase